MNRAEGHCCKLEKLQIMIFFVILVSNGSERQEISVKR